MSPAGVEKAKNVTVRYWAAARAAAGVEQDVVELPPGGSTTLAAVLDEAVSRRPGDRRFADVVAICSVLVGEVPVGARPYGDVVLGDGDVVELLPPFAGG
ncbi:MoaD/ThiS family protein [Aeromicrobium sp. CTD01-1L150]|uniref:MoaD/ThiS family protein n=1 Tax=Aeromicrobium sp. CTD01-1L150 TaxID=3341830 RepID=UPI0035C0FB3B